jgi:serine/threonine protein kinase
MAMAGSGGLGRLNSADWKRLQQLTDRLESTWHEDKTVQIADLLPPAGDSLRPVALVELIKTDLEIRWRRHRAILLEDYARQFPELAGPDGLPAELLYEEYRIRQLHGDRPPLDSYARRFPEQFRRLKELVDKQPLPTDADKTFAADEPTLPGTAGTPPEPGPKGAGTSPVPGPWGDQGPEPSEMLPIVGGYRKIKRLGSGSFGEVWRAEAPGNVEVAIKIIFRPLNHEEAQRELQALELIKQLRHPFLLQTHAYWPLQDRLLIAMELADGSLRDRLAECRATGLKGIPAPELLIYFREAAEALDYLHQQQVQHRDIKPDNILILKQHAKVADFGMARLVQNFSADATMVGTPAYMPPESWQGLVSEHSDQYSLAASYAELRLDRRLFSGSGMLEIMRSAVEQDPKLDPLPEAEQRVLRQALAKDPKDRYPTCLEFAQALEKALAPPPPELPPVGPPSRWRTLVTAALALAVIVMASLLLIRHFARLKPMDLTVRAGEEGSFVLPIPRTSAGEAIEFQLSKPEDLPPGIRIFRDPAASHEAGMAVNVQALPVAITGQSIIPIQLATNSRQWPTTVKLTIEPPAAPPGCKAVVGTDLERIGEWNYSKRVTFVLENDTDVTFVLVPPREAADLPFYIMEDKVWNGLFAKFAAARPELVHKDGWELGARAEAGGIKMDLLNTNDRLPVFRVTVEEANRFANWFAGKKGKLPSVREWDLAAGRYEKDRGIGPCPSLKLRPGGSSADLDEDSLRLARIGIHRAAEGPMSLDDNKTLDISPYGCRHMSGNGLEWTRTLAEGKGEAPLSDRKDDAIVVLRGRDYAGHKPLLWHELETLDPESQAYGRTGPEISFRIVIELE